MGHVQPKGAKGLKLRGNPTRWIGSPSKIFPEFRGLVEMEKTVSKIKPKNGSCPRRIFARSWDHDGLLRRDRSPIRICPATLRRPDPQAFGESSTRSTAVFRFKNATRRTAILRRMPQCFGSETCPDLDDAMSSCFFLSTNVSIWLRRRSATLDLGSISNPVCKSVRAFSFSPKRCEATP